MSIVRSDRTKDRLLGNALTVEEKERKRSTAPDNMKRAQVCVSGVQKGVEKIIYILNLSRKQSKPKESHKSPDSGDQ